MDDRSSEFLGTVCTSGFDPEDKINPLKQVMAGIPITGHVYLAPGRAGWMLRLFGNAHQMELVFEGSSSSEELGK